MSNGEEERRGDEYSTDDTAQKRDKESSKSSTDSAGKVKSKINQEASAKKQPERKPKETKSDDDDSCISSGDICRICHMGGFSPSHAQNVSRVPTWEWQNQAVRRAESQISSISSYAYLGPLISACKCRGTVALVHAECLERWLTESGHSRCELCGYRYATKRVPRHSVIRSVIIWFNSVIATRQMLQDALYLLITTPLALFSCYICALALKMMVESGFYDVPWMIVAMLPTCTLTLVAYWSWLISLGRIHGRRWRRYWRNNFVVRLLPDSVDNPDDTGTIERRSIVRFDEDDGFDRRRNEEVEDLIQIH